MATKHYKTKFSTITRSFSALVIALFLNMEIAEAQIQNVPQEIAPIVAPFDMPQLERPQIPDRTFDIQDFGAKKHSKNSTFKNTDAFHAAINAASEAGGGRVLVPKG